MEEHPNTNDEQVAVAYVLISIRLDNVFTRKQLKESGKHEMDLLVKRFNGSLKEMVDKASLLNIEDMSVYWQKD